MRWVIGDIHGMYRPLARLLDALDARDPDATFVFVGDYVNRGPDSREVVQLLVQLPPGKAMFCRGNHDDILDLILNHTSFASGADPLPAFAWFMAHGLDKTLVSYGIDLEMIEFCEAHPSPKRLMDLVAPVPHSHRNFFRNLPLALEFEDIFIIHAKWHTDDADGSPSVLLSVMQERRLQKRSLWERFSDAELMREKHWRRRGFFGHTPVINYEIGEDDMPIVANGCVLVDTGVALSKTGRLSAFCVETGEVIQTTHFGELLSNHR